MASKKRNSNAGARQGSRTSKNSRPDLPAEPEVTQQRQATTGPSNPGRDPAGGAAVSAARERAITENNMRNQRGQFVKRPQARSASTPSSSSTTTGMLSLIGGASIGAALMYLFDPEGGQRRRAQVRSAAAHAAERSGDVLHNAWDMASERLSPLAERAMERASEMGSSGMAAASSMGSQMASNFMDRAGDAAHDVGAGARRHMRSARQTAAGWLGHEEKSHMPGAGSAAAAVACLAAGVGAMYLLDPTDGARRRTMIRDKANHWLSETGDFFRRTGRHLANRSRGMAHETASMFQREDVSDRQLAERIRSRIGHLRQQSMVNIAAVDGRVTITGSCTPSDVDSLLAVVQSTPGVASIVNLLDVSNISASPTT